MHDKVNNMFDRNFMVNLLDKQNIRLLLNKMMHLIWFMCKFRTNRIQKIGNAFENEMILGNQRLVLPLSSVIVCRVYFFFYAHLTNQTFTPLSPARTQDITQTTHALMFIKYLECVHS